MSRNDRKRLRFKKGAAAKAAPGSGAEGDDVKVPIEVDGEEPKDRTTPEGRKGPEKETTPGGSHDPATKDGARQDAGAKADGKASGAPDARQGEDAMDEQAMIDAAIRAGEKAAEEDFKSDADKVKKERDRLAKQLGDAADDIAKAKAAAKESADRLARLQADWDNYRRRTATERLAERDRATEKLVKNLLPVIDDMERAIAHANAAADGDENLRQFSDGIQAVHTKLLDVLSKEGVGVIDPAGKAFDPLCHQAVGRVEDKDVFLDTVRDVYQPGYEMGGKVLRPAMVTVTFGGAARPVEPAEAGDKGPDADASGSDKSTDAGSPKGDAGAEKGSAHDDTHASQDK